MTDATGKAVVLYDGECPLCQRSVAILKRLDFQRFDLKGAIVGGSQGFDGSKSLFRVVLYEMKQGFFVGGERRRLREPASLGKRSRV